jgi:hypothetical protein
VVAGDRAVPPYALENPDDVTPDVKVPESQLSVVPLEAYSLI